MECAIVAADNRDPYLRYPLRYLNSDLASTPAVAKVDHSAYAGKLPALWRCRFCHPEVAVVVVVVGEHL